MIEMYQILSGNSDVAVILRVNRDYSSVTRGNRGNLRLQKTRVTGKTSIMGHLEYLFHFLTENEIENASFFDASIFSPIFQSGNLKLSHNIKPCLGYHVTGIWFYCASK